MWLWEVSRDLNNCKLDLDSAPEWGVERNFLLLFQVDWLLAQDASGPLVCQFCTLCNTDVTLLLIITIVYVASYCAYRVINQFPDGPNTGRL